MLSFSSSLINLSKIAPSSFHGLLIFSPFLRSGLYSSQIHPLKNKINPIRVNKVIPKLHNKLCAILQERNPYEWK